MSKTVFISHSKHDRNGRRFFDSVFASTSNISYWYSFVGPKPPHAASLLKAISDASSVFVVLSKPMGERHYTRSWVGYEAGVAVSLKKNVIVFERFDEFVNLPVPGASAYIQRPSSVKDLEIQNSFPFWDLCDNGGESITLSRRSPPSMYTNGEVTCPNVDCKARYSLILWHNVEKWHCPVCREAMELQDIKV